MRDDFGLLQSGIPPEIVAGFHGLRTRDDIAKALLAQGMEPIQVPQNKGRLESKISPWQGIAQLGKAAAGAYGLYRGNEDYKQLGSDYRKLMADEIAGYMEKLNSGTPAAAAVPGQAGNMKEMIAATPGRTLDVSMPLTPTSPAELDTRSPSNKELTRNVDFFKREMPDTALGQGSQFMLDQRAVNPSWPSDPPRDVGPDLAAQALTMPTPAQPARPGTGQYDPATVERVTREMILSQNPQARALGMLQAQQAFQAKTHGLTRELTREQKAEDRDVRREGIEANVLMRMEQLRTTSALTQMQIESREQQGRDSTELKKQLADQTAELKKMEIQARREVAGASKTPSGFRQTKDGNLEAIPGGPADIKIQAKNASTEGGRVGVSNLVTALRDIYDQLDQGGGITNPDQSAASNVLSGTASSGLGQMVGKIFGTQNQSLRNQIAQQRPLLLQAIKNATGMSAKQMDSNVELKMYLAAATDPTLDVKANRAALDKLEELFGLSGAKESAPKGGPATITNDADYQALPSGTEFVGPDGQRRKKP